MKMCKNDDIKVDNLNRNLDARGFLTTFIAENTTESRSWNSKNNAQTLSKQPQNKSEKLQKMTFWTPKMIENDFSKRPK